MSPSGRRQLVVLVVAGLVSYIFDLHETTGDTRNAMK